MRESQRPHLPPGQKPPVERLEKRVGPDLEQSAAATTARAATAKRETLWELGIALKAWRFFSSIKLALVLILGIATLVLAGTLLDQVPASVLADSRAYSQWLTVEHRKYGAWTNVFDRVQLFNVFHALYFRLILGALALNIMVCTANRLKAIWIVAFRTRVRMGQPFFEHAKFRSRIEVACTPAEAAERIRRTLSRSRYRVKLDRDDHSVALFGDLNRLSPFGTIFTHLSLILILGGAVAGGIWGFKDSEFIVAEGTTRPLGNDTNVSVRLDQFVDEYYVDGPPRDFRSDVVVFDGGKQVAQGSIRVNSPLVYKGIAFHQAFYGQTAIVKVEDTAGKVLFNDSVPLAWQTNDGQRPVGSFSLPAQGLDVYVIGPESGVNDRLIPPGEMRFEVSRQSAKAAEPTNLIQGTPVQLAGLTFTFERESRFAGLKVVKDPGVNIIWVGAALMIVGMVLLFYLPRRRVWALCKQTPDGSTEVFLAMPVQRDISLESEFEHLRAKIARALQQPPTDKTRGGSHA